MVLLIQNGLVVTAEKSERADLLIRNGLIDRVAPHISMDQDIHQVIDASGKYVIPGGVDPHVHMQLPTPAGDSADDFRQGSIAALMGGTTCFIDFVTPRHGQSLPQALEERQLQAAASLADHSLHVSPIDVNQHTEAEISECISRGVRSFKVYMAYLDTIGLQEDSLGKVMNILGKHGAMLTVHAEMGSEIEALRNEYFSQGNTDPRYHALSRPAQTEAKAVEKVLAMARKANCAVYLVHISSAASLPFIQQAQQSGQKVFAETCPQYLLLNDEVYNRSFAEAAPFVMSPPLRKPNDNEALWQAIASGVVRSAGTDHCPFSMQQKGHGEHDFRKIPNGTGGVEHRLALLYTFGVLQGKISLNEWVALTSTNPARIFGLYPRKGNLMPGAHADVVIWDPNATHKISAATHHQQSDINVYEGITTNGAPQYVIAGGRIVAHNGRLLTTDLKGKFLPQELQ